MPWLARAAYRVAARWRREREYPWFALIGVVASGITNPEDKKEPPRNEAFLIGEGTDIPPRGSGYLYCFANDLWSMYHNNRGSIRLTVTRLAAEPPSPASAQASGPAA